MIAWMKSRMKAKKSACRPVQFALEVNQVLKSLHEETFGADSPSVTTRILPYLPDIDLVSYSAYDSQHTPYFKECLQLIKSNTVSPIYIGEFGCDELSVPAIKIQGSVINIISTASDMGCLFALVWQIYNNEPGSMFGLLNDKNEPTVVGKMMMNYLKQ